MIADTQGEDPRLAELLIRWEDLQEQGRSVSADELCSACPELAEELGRRIALLRRLDPMLDGTRTADVGPPRPPTAGARARESASARAEFRDLRFHAEGALGEVFMARNAELNREVALKFLKAERTRDADSLRRFLQEAEVTGRLEHPGVVPIYALGTDSGGSPCYAMRFIRGETLQDAIDAFHSAEKPGRDPSERSLFLRELLNRFVSICNTMAYAHNRGILHRDLKPRNVMLGKYDETLVVDWGLAKPFERDDFRYYLAVADQSSGRWADAEYQLRHILAGLRHLRISVIVLTPIIDQDDLDTSGPNTAEPDDPDSVAPLSMYFTSGNDEELYAVLSMLGLTLLKQAKWSEAEPLLRECLAIREKTIPDAWSRFNTMSQLGGALLGQGRYAEAESLILTGYEGMKARQGKISPAGRPRLPEAAERVLRLYDEWNKPDQAVAWKTKLGLLDLPASVFAPP
jgi:tRNA A-37 threonylcarbamoyl transferase component Bud32